MEWLVYLVLGSIAGLLAGLLGVGGGIVIVPMLDMAFAWQGLPSEYSHHMALATSLGTIVFTSISSLKAHNSRGAVLWPVVKAITPGILVGTFLGTRVAAHLSTGFLKGFFVAFLYYVAVQMLLNIKPKPTRNVPGLPWMIGAGLVIGLVSALVGIGGGTMSVPFMTWCNISMHQAVGTSAAIGLPIALAGAIGFVVNAPAQAGLPAMSLGFLYLPALIGIALVSVFTAPLGARLAHSLPVPKLKRVFAIFLLFMATRMLVSLL